MEKNNLQKNLSDKDRDYEQLRREYQTYKAKYPPNSAEYSAQKRNSIGSMNQTNNPTYPTSPSHIIKHPNKSRDSQGVFDSLNDSALSELRNELFTARKLQGDEKERVLMDIQDKLNELIDSTKPNVDYYMAKFHELSLENQQLKID